MVTGRCPGMDPGYFKPEDVHIHACVGCGYELEFWKDDVRLECRKCGHVNFNPDLGRTCLSWCKEAAQCIGNDDIKEWLARHGGDGCEIRSD